MKIHGFLSHVVPFLKKNCFKKVSGTLDEKGMFLDPNRPVSIP